MTNAKNEEGVWFQAIGRVGDYIDLRTSAKGTQYARAVLLVKNQWANSDRKLYMTAFDKTAEAVAEGMHKGALVKVKGEISKGKNQHGQWEEKFFIKTFECLAEAPHDDPEQVEEAMQAADFDDINF